MKLKKPKSKLKKRDEAEQHGYDVGVAETEDVLREEVPAVCRAYYTQTWEEALNRAGIDASSKLRRPENIIFPLALQISNQKEAARLTTQSTEEAQPQHLPSSNQQEQDRERETLKDSSSDKVVEVLQPEAASQNFEKELASTTLLVEGAPREKKKEIPPEAANKASKSRIQIKLKP